MSSIKSSAKPDMKESILAYLKNQASALNKDTLTKSDLDSKVYTNLRYYFGSLKNALECAGLCSNEPGYNLRNHGPKLTDDELFQNLLLIEDKVMRIPKMNDLHNGVYSNRPYKRFGNWNDVQRKYIKFKIENGYSSTNKTVNISAETIASNNSEVGKIMNEKFKFNPKQVYGDIINFRGLIHAPINEQGVVFLFGMVSKELGFRIESVQQGFPDCAGKFCYDGVHWASVTIEFEFTSLNFKTHCHDTAGCDFIICWEHDWKECPENLNVIELKSEITKLPNV